MRRILLAVVMLGLVGVAAYWFVTRPQVDRRERLAGAQAQSRERQGDVLRRRLRRLPRDAEAGGPHAARRRHGAEVAVRLVLSAQHLAASEGRHRRLDRGPFRHRDDEGHVAGRAPLFPVVSLHVLSAHDARRPARHVRLHQDAAAGRGPRARSRHPLSVQHPARARRLEVPPSRRSALHARSEPAGGMESRRLSRERPRPLRRVPQPAQPARRHRRGASGLPAVPIRKARARSRTSPSTRSRTIPTRTSWRS